MKHLLIFLTLAFPASAQDASLRYATMPDLATAQSLAHAAWLAVQCDPQPTCDVQQVTKYVYPIVGLSNGKYAIVIHTGDVYQGEHLSLPNGKSFDLTAQQISSLSTRPAMAGLLADVLTVATVGSRITAPQNTAIMAYANTHPAFKTSYQTLTGAPIDLQGTLIYTVLNELRSAGILTDADITAITAPNSVAAVP